VGSGIRARPGGPERGKQRLASAQAVSGAGERRLACVLRRKPGASPSMIERLARLREPRLPQAAIAYTRRVTQVWCVFFAINGAIALVTAIWASDQVWALYNGSSPTY